MTMIIFTVLDLNLTGGAKIVTDILDYSGIAIFIVFAIWLFATFAVLMVIIAMAHNNINWKLIV